MARRALGRGFAPGVLKRTSRYADGFIPTYATVEGYREAQKQIKEQAEAHGRDPSSIEWGIFLYTYLGSTSEEARHGATELGIDEARFEQGHVIGSPQDCIDIIERYAELGMTQFVMMSISQPADMVSQYELIATEVLPHFKNWG